MSSLIDQAIQKYGGSDEIYKNKLKEGIRDSLGYSNYMSKLGKETSSPAAAPEMKGNILPSGVLAGQEAGYSMQNARINTLQGITGAIDSAAESIASKLAAKNKASMKNQFDSSFIFNPANPVEDDILRYAQNPYNEDGSVKSLQQFESELNEKFGQTEGYGPEDIKNMIVDKLPPDYIGKEGTYAYRFAGMSEKQAADEQLIDYGNLILMGKGDQVPKELYPLAYASLSDAEKSALARMKLAPKSAAATAWRNKFEPKDEEDELLGGF